MDAPPYVNLGRVNPKHGCVTVSRPQRFIRPPPDRGDGMSDVLTAFAFLTGLVTGGVFAFLEVPIPAPPNLAGVLGIVGIFVGFKLVEATGVGFDVLGALGL